MKRVLFILCLVTISIGFTSCGDDDTVDESNLIGTWKLTEFNTQQAYDINYNGTSSSNLLDEIYEVNAMSDLNCMTNELLTFNTNNTVLISNSTDFDFGVYIYDGQETFDIDCDEFSSSETITYSQNGNEVTIDIDDENTIVTVNGNQLSFVLSEYLYTYNEVTNEETYDDVTLVYIKQ